MRQQFVAIAAAFVLISFATPAAAETVDVAAEERPSAVVSLGDSYISGEGGRWQGNYSRSTGDRGGTDRAAYRNSAGWFKYDAGRVYGSTDDNGCHRSDVAPVLSSGIAVDNLINLACSGATSQNLVLSGRGGLGQRGEPSQADQLVDVAAAYDVEMIVVSIGGNDLGFGDIIFDCTVEYLTSPSWAQNTCNGEKQESVDARMAAVMAGVSNALSDIQTVMTDAGYERADYRLVLQSYASPIPSGDEFRYPESGWRRSVAGGCPFWNVDATWARDNFVPQVSANLASAAAEVGAEFLDLQDALEGREVCSQSTSQKTGTDAEWGRFLVTGIFQGEAQESLHPNALGQQANGTCIGLVYGAAPGNYRCTNVAGSGPDTMSLAKV